MLGCTPAAVIGCYGMIDFQLYIASLPPGSAACGNPFVESLLLTVFGAPLCGVICATVARILSLS